MIDLKNMKFKELSDFCGAHTFSGCEFRTEIVKREFGFEEESGVGIFVLDGVSYAAIEDPYDGYRSFLGGISLTTERPRYEFPPVEVFCHMDESTSNEILFVRSAKTGNVILKVGTENTDDYYPYYRFEFIPENIGKWE